ncbi:MAG TPA: preprotein translocase subunit SecG [Gemmatimonadaceae bacterium]|nr:preprotein translocase subunit SecG [Gemmatimonadaceae bacterium]
MYTALLVLLVIVSVILVVAILLQSGKGSGLAASFGGASSSSDAFMGSHQIATGLTKGTWYLGGVFLLLAYILAIMSARPSVPKSVLDQPAQTQAPAQQLPASAPGAAPIIPLQNAPAAPAPAPAPAPSQAPAKAPPR